MGHAPERILRLNRSRDNRELFKLGKSVTYGKEQKDKWPYSVRFLRIDSNRLLVGVYCGSLFRRFCQQFLFRY